MRVLSVASEVFPLVKTGGLADVVGALPPALARQGVEARTLVPGYPAVMGALEDTEELVPWASILGARARLVAGRAAGLDLIALDAPELYDRPGGIYLDANGRDHSDNWRRFAALSKVGAEMMRGLAPGFAPDILHAHDWQAALAPAYMRFYGIDRPSIVTIHNIAFQGHFGPGVFGALELPPEAFSVEGVEYYGGVGFLKAGLRSAWAVTTVSPTYAEEIRTPAFGMGLEGLINTRADTVFGIVNGIDTEIWDPETDPMLVAPFSARKLKGRAENRRAVEARFGLGADGGPLFCVVSRLTGQKGIDLIVQTAGDLVAAGGRLAVLGSGEGGLESAMVGLAATHPGRIGVVIGYDEPLSHVMQGGCDAILIPSRFEPCGLTQLYGLRYGCVPVVARVGGLADTVIDANIAALNAGVATGVQFAPVDAASLRRAILRAIELFRGPHWAGMQRAGMKADVSWDRSAALYVDLYTKLLPNGEP